MVVLDVPAVVLICFVEQLSQPGGCCRFMFLGASTECNAYAQQRTSVAQNWRRLSSLVLLSWRCVLCVVLNICTCMFWNRYYVVVRPYRIVFGTRQQAILIASWTTVVTPPMMPLGGCTALQLVLVLRRLYWRKDFACPGD